MLHILHWATESEKYIILTLFYDQNYVNLSNLKFHPLCHTKSSFFWKSPTYRFVTSYLLSVNVTHENEKNKNGRLYMLKHYFCKNTIDRDTLFWGSYSLSFICGHIDLFCIMFYPCPSVFPSIMFWFPFNSLSLLWSNVLKFGCVKNRKRSVNFDLGKSGASVSHVHLCFIWLYFLLVKYRIKMHV